MNTRNLRGWRWIRSVSSVVLFVGCAEHGRVTNAQSPVVTEAPASRSTTRKVEATEFRETTAAESSAATAKQGTLLPTDLSPAVAEIVRLAETGVGDEVLLAFIRKSSANFDLTADEIVYLNDLGLSDAVVTAMMQHEGQGTVAGSGPTVYTPGSISTTPAPAPATAGTSQRRVTTRTTTTTTENYPDVEYASPEAEYQNSTGAMVQDAPVVTSAPTEQVTINYFYDTLSPYGTWVDVSGYGRCWRPTVAIVNRDWRPYGDRGRWIYSDAGWYWHSDYSWGWAPFHYGRWHSDAHFGWVWTPGDVWAPSWVSWRRSSYYCGWAPLPPTAHYDTSFGFHYYGSRVGLSFEFGLGHHDYFFLPTSRFCDRYPSRHRIRGDRVNNVYNNSTVVNNYINGNNNTVINEGIGRDHVAAATRTEVPRVALQEISSTERASIKPDRFVGDGKALAVYRPRLAPASRTTAANSGGGSEVSKNGGVATTSKPGMADRGNPSPVLKSDVLLNRPDVAKPSAGSATLAARPTLAQVQAVTPAAKVEALSRPASSSSTRPGFSTARPGFSTSAKSGNPENQESKVASIGRPGTREATRSALEPSAPNRSSSENRLEPRSTGRTSSSLNAPSRTAPGPQVTPQYKAPKAVISPDTTPAPAERPRFVPSSRGQERNRIESSSGSTPSGDRSSIVSRPPDQNGASRRDEVANAAPPKAAPDRSFEARPSVRHPESSSRPRFENSRPPQSKNEAPRSVTIPNYPAPNQNSAPDRPQYNPAPSPRSYEQPQPRSYSAPAPTHRPEARPQYQPAPMQRSEPRPQYQPQMQRSEPRPQPQYQQAPAPRSAPPSHAPQMSRPQPSSPPPSSSPRSESSSGRPGFRRDNQR